MPTPSPSSNETIVAATSLHSSCPPDDDRANWRVVDMDVPHDEAIATAPEVLQQPTPPPAESRPAGSTDTHIAAPHNTKQMDIDEDNSGPDMLSPMSAEGDKQEESELPALPNTDLGSPSMGYDFSNIRVCAPCLHVDTTVQPLTLSLAYSILAFFFFARRKQVSRHPAIGTPSIRCTGRDQACGHEGVISLWIFAYPR